MKTSLPVLSALWLAALAAAVVAPCPSAEAQGGGAFTRSGESADVERGDDAAAPYRAGDVPNEETIESATEHLPPGPRLLVRSKHALANRASLFAKLRHQVSLDGRQYIGVGSYWQQGTGQELQVYWELQFAGPEASLLQVTNDRFFWLDRKLPTGRTVTRIDLRALRAEQRAWRGPDDDGATTLAATFDDSALVFGAQQGGLPGLLASLLDQFQFLPPQAMRLSITPPLSNDPRELAVFAVVGHWKPEKLAQLLGEASRESRVESQEPEIKREIPERFPQEVLLLVGQSDLLPYRVEYRRRETPAPAGNTEQIVAYQLSAAPLVVLELAEIAIDPPIAAGQFDYAPPSSVEWSDQTAILIQRLRKQRQARVADGDPASRSSAAGR